MQNNNSQELRNNQDNLYPHSPDVLERETSDNGFSSGWGMHFAPVPKYWIDVHTHVFEKNPEKAGKLINNCFKRFDELNVRSIAAISPRIIRMDEKDAYISKTCLTDIEDVCSLICEIRKDKLALPFINLNYTRPDLDLIEEAVKNGICGVKLHNAPVITDGADPEVWFSEEWGKVFKLIERHNLPVLWHVTQRLTDSPYTGGDRNSYWKVGWEKGVKYTNEDLLQIYLKVVEKFSDIKFISAHQLHLGWDRLTGLLDSYKNLYTDTSCGCIVRQDYELYDHDREYLRNIFIKYSDRIIFGTDLLINDKLTDYYINDTYNVHMRFINQLRLPDEVIQKISHENAERIMKDKL